jgi:hypothetical protein
MEAQVYAAIQMGYFKAKHIFFRFSFHKVPQDDLRFILTHCFTNQTLQAFNITKYEHYRVCGSIMKLFSYKPWSNFCQSSMTEQGSALNGISHQTLLRMNY